MNPNDFDLTQAGQSYAVANTPLFLMRKLQFDPEVRAIGDTRSAQEILEALTQAINAVPTSPAEAVRPYAFLVALSQQSEIEPLHQAGSLAAPLYDWFGYIAGILIETFSPVQSEIIQLPGQLAAPPVSVKTTTPANRIELVLH